MNLDTWVCASPHLAICATCARHPGNRPEHEWQTHAMPERDEEICLDYEQEKGK